jgi:phosphoribosylanthranilate isomerase
MEPSSFPFIIKVCGLTREEDALAAAQWGANALGFVFVPGVSRTVEPEAAAALMDRVRQVLGAACPWMVGVFAHQPPEEVQRIADRCGLDVVQVHAPADAAFFRKLRAGQPERQLWKAVAVDSHRPAQWLADLAESPVDAFVLDAPKGGPSRPFDWDLMAVAQRPEVCGGRPVLLAGGLTADNVAEAIRRTRPAGVDVSSGIESEVRRKDLQKMARFIREAQRAAEELGRERGKWPGKD